MLEAYLLPLVAAFSLSLTGLAIGLYLGERGRRLAAERVALHGNPTGTPARVLTPAIEPEERIAKAGSPSRDWQVSRETVQRGIAALQAAAKQAGRPMSAAEAERQALAMLHPEFNPEDIGGSLPL